MNKYYYLKNMAVTAVCKLITHKFIQILTFLVLFFAASLSNTVYAVALYTRQNSDWQDINTWSYTPGGPTAGVIPTAADDVFIDHNVPLTNAAPMFECRDLVVRNGGWLRFNYGSTTHLLRVHRHFLIDTGGVFVQNNNQGYPVEIYGNFTINGEYRTTNQNSGFVKITMKGAGGPTRFIGGNNFSNNNNERRFVDLTIDLATPNDVITLQNDIYFAEVNANNPNVVKLNVVQGIFNATGRTINFWKFGQIITTANGRIAWKNIDCDYEAPNIHWISPEAGSDLVVTSPYPLYINNFTFGTGKENFKFPNNSNAQICILGYITRDKSNQDYGTGQFFWGPNSNYIRTVSTGTAEPNPSSGANGPAKISGVTNAAYQPPNIIQQYLYACENCDMPATKTIQTQSLTVCTNQSIDIQILNSQTGVIYSLFNGTTQIGGNIAGNGGTVSFNNVTFSTAGNVTLTVKTSTTNTLFCKGETIGTISITVTSMPTPTIVTATPNYNSVNLTFNLATGSPTSHTLYRCDAVGANCVQIMGYSGGTTYTDTGLTEGTNYCYKFVANFGSTCSTQDVKCVKTLSTIPEKCSSYCAQINKISNTTVAPTIDATMESLWDRSYEYPISRIADGNPQSGYSGSWRALYDATYLYFYVKINTGKTTLYRVTGGNSWMGDDVQFGFPNGGGARQFGVHFDGTKTNYSGFNVNNITAATSYSGGSYVVEVRIPWSEIGYNYSTILATGLRFEVATDINNGSNTRLVQYTTFTTDGGWFNTNNNNTYPQHLDLNPCNQYIKIEDEFGNRGNTFCENSPVTITAGGNGFGDLNTIKWYKGEGTVPPITTQPIGLGSTITVAAPWSVSTTVGNSELYWIVGTLCWDTVRIYSHFCCSSIGESTIVHAEYYNGLTYQCPRALDAPGGRFSNLPAGDIIGNAYTYVGSDCSRDRVNDGYYAIVQNTLHGDSPGRDMWGNNSFPEHTGVPGSGMLLVNAQINTGGQIFYKHLLTGLCNNTTYEFSAWYAAIKPENLARVNISFEVWQSDAYGNNIGGSAIKTFVTGDVNDNVATWHKASMTFTTPPSGTGYYTINLINNTYTSNNIGNDLVIDDIVVTKCTPNVYAYEQGTTNVSVSVCSDDPVNLEVVLSQSMIDLITNGQGGNMYVQWMWSTSPTGPVWTPIGVPTTSFTFPALPGGINTTIYYRAKISADSIRASQIYNPLSACFNDAITFTFELIQTGNLIINTTPAPNTTSYICDGTIDLIGDPGDATHWGWVKKDVGLQYDTIGMTYYTVGGKTITVNAAGVGTYYFVAYKGTCRAYKEVTVEIQRNLIYETKKDTACIEELPYIFNGEQYWCTGIYKNLVTTTGCNDTLYTIDLFVPGKTSFNVDTYQTVSHKIGTYTTNPWHTSASTTTPANYVLQNSGDNSTEVNVSYTNINPSTTSMAICNETAGVNTILMLNAAYDAVSPRYFHASLTSNSIGCTIDAIKIIGQMNTGAANNGVIIFSNQINFNLANATGAMNVPFGVTTAPACPPEVIITGSQIPAGTKSFGIYRNYNVGGTFGNSTSKGVISVEIKVTKKGEPYIDCNIDEVIIDTTYLTICDDAEELPPAYQAVWASEVNFPHNIPAGSSSNYEKHITSIYGCDSVIVLNLSVEECCVQKNHEFSAIACNFYVWDGRTYNSSGDYDYTYLTSNGCDSIVTLHLTINPSKTFEFSVTTCDSYVWDGRTYNSSGDYDYTYSTSNGCDSIVTLHLTINSSKTFDFSDTACGSYDWDGRTYTSSGDYEYTYQTSNGCDSIVTLNLTIKPISYSTDNQNICGNIYKWIDGNTYTSSNNTATHTIVGGAANGCDSIVTLNLTLTPYPTKDITATICNISGYNFYGKILTVAGTYYDTIPSTTGGCDTIVKLVLNTNFITKNITAETCSGVGYDFYGNILNNSGTYLDTIPSTTGGCDTIVSLSLTVNAGIPKIIQDVTCTTLLPYNFYGIPVNGTVNGLQVTVPSTTSGCDTIAYLFLTVVPYMVKDITATICSNEVYDFYGTPLTSPGNHQHTIYTPGACDTLVRLNLTVKQSKTHDFSATACDSYVWDGRTYNSSGDYDYTYLMSNGCDSIVTLHLTINNTYTSEFSETACDSYTWAGGTHLSSGDYYHTFTAANGCDSIVTLHLTIGGFVTSEFSVTACDYYIWDGRTYNSSGNYNYTYQTNHCDSIVTLHLTINPLLRRTINTTICEGENYNFYGTTYNTDVFGLEHRFANATGCDSIVTLNLEIIKFPKVKVLVPQICADDQSFMLQIEPLSNNYTHFYTNYSIIFDNFTLAAGFVNNQSGQISDMVINVNMPDSVYPNNYNLTLILTNNSVNGTCNTQTITVPFDVLYPDSIMKQKWDNVIALTNYYYNGGYEYAGYQWFENGNIMVGKNDSYIYIGQNNVLDTTYYYTVLITRPDGSQMLSCPFTPHIPKPNVSDYPIVISNNGQIFIYIKQNNLKARIWSVDGRLLSMVDLIPPMSAIDAPWQDAVYLIEIFNEEKSFKQVIPVVVKRGQIR